MNIRSPTLQNPSPTNNIHNTGMNRQQQQQQQQQPSIHHSTTPPLQSSLGGGGGGGPTMLSGSVPSNPNRFIPSSLMSGGVSSIPSNAGGINSRSGLGGGGLMSSNPASSSSSFASQVQKGLHHGSGGLQHQKDNNLNDTYDPNDFPVLSSSSSLKKTPNTSSSSVYHQNTSSSSAPSSTTSSATSSPVPTSNINTTPSSSSSSSLNQPNILSSNNNTTPTAAAAILQAVQSSSSSSSLNQPSIDDDKGGIYSMLLKSKSSATTPPVATSSSSSSSSDNSVSSSTNNPSDKQQQQQLSSNVHKYGLLGLLNIIKTTDVDLSTLSIGIDLTCLGLNLNSPGDLYNTFGSPWYDIPINRKPEYYLPLCYSTPGLDSPSKKICLFTYEALFYIFYSMPKDILQIQAAMELYDRDWRYHKEGRVWLTKVPNTDFQTTPQYEVGSYFIFDVSNWETVRRDNFILHHNLLEPREVLVQQLLQQQQQQQQQQQPPTSLSNSNPSLQTSLGGVVGGGIQMPSSSSTSTMLSPGAVIGNTTTSPTSSTTSTVGSGNPTTTSS